MNPQEQKPAAFTVSAFCKWANISPSQCYKQIRLGNLSMRKCGRRTLILRSDAETWLNDLPKPEAAK